MPNSLQVRQGLILHRTLCSLEMFSEFGRTMLCSMLLTGLQELSAIILFQCLPNTLQGGTQARLQLTDSCALQAGEESQTHPTSILLRLSTSHQRGSQSMSF